MESRRPVKSITLASLAIVLASVSQSSGQEAQDDKYQAAFGAEERAVMKTVSAADDLKFAAKLIKTARSSTTSTAYRTMLYEKVYEYSVRSSSGYRNTMEALNYLTRAAPERKSEWLDKKLKAMTKRYVNSFGVGRKQIAEDYLNTMLAVAAGRLAAGKLTEAEGIYRRAYSVATQCKSPLKDEIRAKSAELTAAAALERKTAQLKRALAAKPSARNRENLIYHYLADLNDPAGAAALVTENLDKTLAANVALVATPAATLEPAKCLELAKWCESIAKRPISAKGKLNVYNRARYYYNKFLTLGKMTAREAALVKRSVQRLDKIIDKMDPRSLMIDCGRGVKMQFRRLKPGKFMLGSPKTEPKRGSDEGPQTLVEIAKPFYIGLTEVTRKQYNVVMGTVAEVTEPNMPEVRVSPAAAKVFCIKLSKLTSKTVRLPTEAEWEYACRAGSSEAYCFGGDTASLGAYAWTSLNSAVDKKLTPHPVRTRKANAWGLFDMHGNVREITISPYSSTSYAGAATLATQNPAVCTHSSKARGGSAGRDPSFCRSANRVSISAGDSLTGFRVVIEVKKKAPLR
jgi:hypothetical protein